MLVAKTQPADSLPKSPCSVQVDWMVHYFLRLPCLYWACSFNCNCFLFTRSSKPFPSKSAMVCRQPLLRPMHLGGYRIQATEQILTNFIAIRPTQGSLLSGRFVIPILRTSLTISTHPP